MTQGNSIQLPIEPAYHQALPPSLKHQLIKLSAEFDEITTSYNTLKLNQGKLSRLIGESKRRGEDTTQLIEEMKRVSNQIKQLKIELDTLNKQAREMSRSNSDSPEKIPDQPRHFLPPERTSHQEIAGNITVCTVNSSELIGKWRQYTHENSRCSVYHQIEFRDIIERAFGHRCIYLIAQDKKGTPRGILPSVQLNSHLFGNYIVSMPFFNYGGAIADSEAIEKQLMQHLVLAAKDLGAKHIEFRDAYARESLPVKNSKVSMIRQLPASADQLWDDIGAKVRAQVNKANSHNPQVRFGGNALLNDFYTVFSTNMRDLGTPVYGKSFFAAILEQGNVKPVVAVVYIGNRPVAGAFLIGHKDTLEIPWASTLKSFNNTNANMFLYWQVLKRAIEDGYSFFDFGRSSPNAGTFRFKKQWGAKPAQMHWHYWLSQGEELPEINPNNPKYAMLIACWKRLPLLVANTLGPAIVKFLP